MHQWLLNEVPRTTPYTVVARQHRTSVSLGGVQPPETGTIVTMNLLETVIDLKAIAHNTRLLQQHVTPAQLMCVVKADGYNHGAVEVAQVMAANGADQFGVATLAEALELRAGGIDLPVLCWMWSPEQNFEEAIAHNIDLAVISPAHAEAVAEYQARVTIKVDTGLRRSGVHPDDWEHVFRLLAAAPKVTVTGLMSHLACADDLDDPATDTQAQQFQEAVELARTCGLDPQVNHLCNSPAALTRPDLHFDMVRPGLACYGLEPISGLDHGLQPAMRWVAKITVVKPIAAGEGVSYGLTWHAEQDGFLAVVPAGYADGLSRMAQGQVEVTINGQRYPQVGRVCMDQIVIDLGSNHQGVSAGDEAIIFGSGGMSATELAERMGDINYTIVCRPTGRTIRRFEHKG